MTDIFKVSVTFITPNAAYFFIRSSFLPFIPKLYFDVRLWPLHLVFCRAVISGLERPSFEEEVGGFHFLGVLRLRADGTRLG